MENRTLYEQIAVRTGGNIYIGVVGPVRTGKSTFIKRFMEQLVLPNIENVYQRERARDELPQSGSGKTIMTAEPKFVPEDAVQISPDGKAKLSVRLIDSVGYMVPGAVGAEEDGQPRMVTTPWAAEEIPMTQAAELGTKRVMEEHCSIGLVMTTDGGITDIPREDYREAEARAIGDMKATGKPFLVLVNSEHPEGEEAQTLCASIREEYAVACQTVNAKAVDADGIRKILMGLMYEFPVSELRYYLPAWVRALPDDHPVRVRLFDAMREAAGGVQTLREAEQAMQTLAELEEVSTVRAGNADLGTGSICCELTLPDQLFYGVLSERSGLEIRSDAELMQLLGQLSQAKKEYDKVADALAQVRATGYGIVMPTQDDLKLEQPEIVRKNGNYAVRLKASAPSIHLMRADIETEISPMVGGEQESEQLISYLLGEYEEDTGKLWQSNIFGKSLFELVNEGLVSKIRRMPDDTHRKMAKTLTRIINENSGGMICILL